MSWRTGATGLLIGVAVALALTATAGADEGYYRAWARALHTGDIRAIGSSTGSPLGLPVIMVVHGPGLAAAAMWKLLPSVLDDRSALHLAGSISALVMWAAMGLVLRRMAGEDRSLAAFGLCALAVGTPAGYYSRAHGSESLALGPIAVLVWYATLSRRWRTSDFLGLGITIALAALMRSNQVLYALPALARATHELWQRTGWSPRLRDAAAVVGPAGLALPQILLVNRWMTGDAMTPPYAFGDAAFRSVDLARPELAAVLFHPWHGLFSYHPIMALGAAAMIALAFRSADVTRWTIVAALLAIAVSLYLHAAWVIWWLGTGTFGMRGLAPASLFVAPAMVAWLRRAPATGRSVALVAACGCATWSWLLLRRGTTQLYTWGSMRDAQADAIAEPATLAIVATGLAAAALVARLGPRHPASRRSTAAAALFVGLLTVAWVAGIVSTTGSTRLLFSMAVVALAGVGTGALVLGLQPRVWPRLHWTGSGAVVAGGGAALLAMTAIFAGMAARTESLIDAGAPTSRFRYRATYEVRQMRGGYDEYLAVEGFEDKKRALRAFLERQGVWDE